MFGFGNFRTLAAAAVLVMTAGVAQAVPLPFTFDFSTTPAGFTITGDSVTNGNCPFGTNPCSHVNDNATITITRTDTISLFDILSATFRFQGQGNGNGILFEGLLSGSVVGTASFLIGASSGFGDAILALGSTPINRRVDYKALFNSNFAGIDTFRITSVKTGNNSAQVRVDSIAGSVAPIPVPAAGLLLLGALGGLAALRRRRRAV